MMENRKMIVFCGLNCYECEAYRATRDDDMKKLANIAERWSIHDNTKYDPEDIICEGCLSERRSSYCKSCEIRECGSERSLSTCADCSKYPCDKLRKEWSS
jgi:hypothetical protein